jgi:hypothetical protein
MIGTRGYTLLGWIVWRLTTMVARRKVQQNRRKIGAAGVIALLIVGGVLAATRSTDS